eukprot:3311894-Rhodomonas_salina.1
MAHCNRRQGALRWSVRAEQQTCAESSERGEEAARKRKTAQMRGAASANGGRPVPRAREAARTPRGRTRPTATTVPIQRSTPSRGEFGSDHARCPAYLRTAATRKATVEMAKRNSLCRMKEEDVKTEDDDDVVAASVLSGATRRTVRNAERNAIIARTLLRLQPADTSRTGKKRGRRFEDPDDAWDDTRP